MIFLIILQLRQVYIKAFFKENWDGQSFALTKDQVFFVQILFVFLSFFLLLYVKIDKSDEILQEVWRVHADTSSEETTWCWFQEA